MPEISVDIRKTKNSESLITADYMSETDVDFEWKGGRQRNFTERLC